MQSFTDLLHELHQSAPQPNPDYYRIIMENAATILLEVSMRNQGVVARDLNMSITRFSQIVPMLKEAATNHWTILTQSKA
jgi:hypothetical protein